MQPGRSTLFVHMQKTAVAFLYTPRNNLICELEGNSSELKGACLQLGGKPSLPTLHGSCARPAPAAPEGETPPHYNSAVRRSRLTHSTDCIDPLPEIQSTFFSGL